MKNQLNENTLEISSAQAKQEELTRRFFLLGQELETSKRNAVQVNEKLEATKKKGKGGIRKRTEEA